MSLQSVGHMRQWSEWRKPAAIPVRPKEQDQMAMFVLGDGIMNCLHFLLQNFFVLKKKTNK